MSRDPYGVTWESAYYEAWVGLWMILAAYTWMGANGVPGVPWFGVFGVLG